MIVVLNFGVNRVSKIGVEVSVIRSVALRERLQQLFGRKLSLKHSWADARRSAGLNTGDGRKVQNLTPEQAKLVIAACSYRLAFGVWGEPEQIKSYADSNSRYVAYFLHSFQSGWMSQDPTTPCLGRDLPNQICAYSGRSLKISTLRAWGKNPQTGLKTFSMNRVFQPEEIKEWILYARKVEMDRVSHGQKLGEKNKANLNKKRLVGGKAG